MFPKLQNIFNLLFLFSSIKSDRRSCVKRRKKRKKTKWRLKKNCLAKGNKMSQKKVTRPCESKHARLSCSLLLYVEWLIREVTQYKCQQSWTRGSHGHIHLRMHSNKPSLERHSTPLRGQAHDRFWNARTFPMLFRSRDPIAGTFIRHLHNTRIRHENRTMTNQKNWLRIQHQFQLNKITDFAFSMTKTGLRIGTCFSGGCFFFCFDFLSIFDQGRRAGSWL